MEGGERERGKKIKVLRFYFYILRHSLVETGSLSFTQAGFTFIHCCMVKERKEKKREEGRKKERERERRRGKGGDRRRERESATERKRGRTRG